MADNKASFLWAIKQQESGGNYSVVNSGSGALGAYQVMPDNVPSWTREALGRSLTPQQFLADPSAQDKVAETILGGYYDKYGARGAAAMWYSGQPDPTKTYGTPSVADYVKSILDRMTTSGPVSGTDPVHPDSGVVQTGVTDSLANGLAQGMTTAFMSVFGPVLLWVGWFATAFVGLGLIVLGTLLILRESKPVQELRSMVTGEEKKPKKESEPLVSDEKSETPTPVRKKSTKKATSKPVKSEQVPHRTPAQAAAPSSFGPAHQSYGPPRTTVKPVRKAVPAAGGKGGGGKGAGAAMAAQMVQRRMQQKAKAKAQRKAVRRG
jgi:hypothetical protein